MKPAALTCMLFLLFAATAKSQFSLRPEIGLDRSKTTITQNDLTSYSPLQGVASFKAQLRMDYRFKNGFGPYAAFGTSPSAVQFNFTNPNEAMNTYRAVNDALRFRMEGGLQYNTKAFQLGKNKSASSKSVTQKTTTTETKSTQVKKSCGSYNYSNYSSHCGAKKKESYARQEKVKPNKTMNMRIQPSLGLAYNPGQTSNIKTEGNSYQYDAGSWRTAVVSGLGFELGKGKQRIGTVSLYYTQGLGNARSNELVTSENGKISTNSFTSKQSSWALTFGVPMTLAKKAKPVYQKSTQSTPAKKSCGSYNSSSYRCIKKI